MTGIAHHGIMKSKPHLTNRCYLPLLRPLKLLPSHTHGQADRGSVSEAGCKLAELLGLKSYNKQHKVQLEALTSGIP